MSVTLVEFLEARLVERAAEAEAEGDTTFGAFARLHVAVDGFKVAVMAALPKCVSPLPWYTRRHYAERSDFPPEWRA
jgi:hypothetical protein